MATSTYKFTAEETAEAIAELRGRLATGQRLYMMDERKTAGNALVRVYVIETGHDGKPDLVNITHWVGRATGRGLKETGGRLGIPIGGYGQSAFHHVAYHLGDVLGLPVDERAGEVFRWEEM